MLLSGVYLFAAGVWLVSLGESPYYANAGIAMRVIAWLVWRGTARALLYTPCCFSVRWPGRSPNRASTVTPLAVDGTIFFRTPRPATGKER